MLIKPVIDLRVRNKRTEPESEAEKKSRNSADCS